MFRDGNAARYPAYPSEPGIRALFMMQPDFCCEDVQFVGCGSTLGNLLRFASGLDKSFRFDIDLIGTTVFFVRKENSPTELIEDVVGYNTSFTEGYTTWPATVAGSVSHQRLIRYDFGGSKLLVRSECDGYLKEKLVPAEAVPNPKKQKGKVDLISALAGVGVASKSPTSEGNLEIRQLGQKVPQNAIFDLKTRSLTTERPIDMTEIKRRLWANQTPNFLFAQHRRGLFLEENIDVQDIKRGVLEWEEANQDLLQRYASILKSIWKTANENRRVKLQVVRIEGGPLRICKQVSGQEVSALPRDLAQTWEMSKGAIGASMEQQARSGPSVGKGILKEENKSL